MLQGRPAQLDILAEEQLLGSICTIVEDTLPHRLPSGVATRGLVSSLVTLGRDFGVSGLRGLARFVCACLILGEDYFRRPEVARCFREGRESPDVLVDRLMTELAGSRATS